MSRCGNFGTVTYLVVTHALGKNMSPKLEITSDEDTAQKLALYDMLSNIFNLGIEPSNFFLDPY